MKNKTLFFVIFFLFCLRQECTHSRFEWNTAPPESEGFSSTKLDVMKDTLASRGTKAFFVIRNDKIVYEWYSPEHGTKKRHYSASLAKAIVGGTSLMLALNDGYISVDDPAYKYIPLWQNDEEKSKITVRHLATHSSGIENALDYNNPEFPQKQLPGWKGEFWRRDPDPFTIARDKAPLIFSPGSDYDYSNPGMAMLAYAVTASVKQAPEPDILTLLQDRIMRPIGVPDEEWSIGYNKTSYKVDGLNLYANWGGGEFTARAAARVGRLMLRKGNWEGRQLVDSEWIEECVKYAGTPIPERAEDNPNPVSGLCWWSNFDGVWSKVPRDAYAGAGAGNQILLVIPSLNIIVVRNGSQIGDTFWGGVEKYLFNPLMEALTGIETPFLYTPAIKNVILSPRHNIIPKADGSDNWPLTWADDDNMYTAYGDGWGFEPKTEKKLSLGFAKITGSPENYKGVNIRSVTGEQIGDGKSGRKASGMLMVDNVLYMWARNANNNGENSQLAWSRDYAKTWTWADWKFEELGYPCFLNFGKNYDNSKDNYVYTYSPDTPSAYNETDKVVMARVPKDRIKNKDAYEFFKGLNAKGNPVWTKNIHKREPVFILRGGCNRLNVVYNQLLNVYLLTMRSSAKTGGLNQFSIYEAPEPWGPWVQVFYTGEVSDSNGWPGDAQHFPGKWMSEDGKTVYMVCSAGDAFFVQKVTFITE